MRQIWITLFALIIAACTTAPSPTVSPAAPPPVPSSALLPSPIISPALGQTPTPNAAEILAAAQARLTTTAEAKNQTATISALTPSPTPHDTFTPAPTPTLDATAEAQATIDILGSICNNLQETYLSPNGLWVAAECRGNDGDEDSHLQVISLAGTKSWTITFGDYAEGIEYDRNNRIKLFRWSLDGRFLYAISPSKFSGCCWLGHHVALIRLNLETGDQIALLNVNGEHYPAISFNLSDDERYLIYLSGREELTLLDLLTWKSQIVDIVLTNFSDASHFIISPNADKIVMVILETEDPIDSEVDSLALIDLVTGDQKKLVTGMVVGEELYPVLWQDADHILLSTYSWNQLKGELWLLNIHTGELTPTTAP